MYCNLYKIRTNKITMLPYLKVPRKQYKNHRRKMRKSTSYLSPYCILFIQLFVSINKIILQVVRRYKNQNHLQSSLLYRNALSSTESFVQEKTGMSKFSIYTWVALRKRG
uniref:Uncharacterized protein n=1 Tax=Cacopsylla melanoneura TaxID=428564 RepID=A0A8D8URM1_9HEMI